MEAASSNIFDKMGQFWAEIADANQTQRQLNFLKNQLLQKSLVLDVACGSGRHTIPLSQAGFNVVGLDISSHLLATAHGQGASKLVKGDLRNLPFKQSQFDAAISMDTSFGYLPSEKEDMQNLVEVRRVLALGGKFVLDVFSRDYLIAKYADKPATPKLHEYPSFYLQQTRTITDNGNQLQDHWTIRIKKDNQENVFEHTVRLYERRRLEAMLNTSGFKVEAVYGDYEKQPYNSTTPRLIILAIAK
jgi:ubiquinone/menaquinone biosynthesis C-methylase UbiE